MQPMSVGDEDAFKFESTLATAKYERCVAGLEKAVAYTKKYKVKAALGTDMLFDPPLAAKQGKFLAKMKKWYTPYEELKMAAGDQPYTVDETLADKVVVPGFIAQHDHPLLSGLTMTSEIIAIEDWVLPSGTVPAAHNPKEYRERLVEGNAKLKDPNALLLTWGYHKSFHGPLTRTDLDKISSTRPIVVWHRSTHDFTLNSKALDSFKIDKEYVDAMPKAAKAQTDFEKGHFWEAGMFAILPRLLPAIATPDRIRAGLEFVVDYYHSNGVTLGSEPGGFYAKSLQDAQNAVMSGPDAPFRYYFIPDGKSIYAAFPDTTITETEKTESWGQGMMQIMPKKIKLLADGTVFSLAMQSVIPTSGRVTANGSCSPTSLPGPSASVGMPGIRFISTRQAMPPSI